MRIEPSRWEHGSEFHWLSEKALHKGACSPWFGPEFVLTGSGRDALRCLLLHGKTEFGWERVLVPSYLCQEVVGSIRAEGFGITVYDDDPREAIDPPIPLLGEALLIVNSFGVRERCDVSALDGGVVIEDHSHDPWSQWAATSLADYCIASMRKTLPIPDGGVIWSPQGHTLPAAPLLKEMHHQAAARKLEAMILKTLYLAGSPVAKEEFRNLAVAGEMIIAAGEASGIHPVSAALMRCLPWSSWRDQRRRNFKRLMERLDGNHGLTVIPPREVGSCPFSVVLVADAAQHREELRNYLIERRIYPAILWPLEEAAISLPKSSVELSRRSLSLHCDGRYTTEDMDRVADAILESMGSIS